MGEGADTLLRSVDSLREAVEHMFLAGARFGPTPSADTLQAALPTTTAADLYGAASTLAAPPRPDTVFLSPTADPAFQALVLLLAAAYALLLYRHLNDAYMLFARSPFENGSGFRPAEIRSVHSQGRFLKLTDTLGLLLAGVLTVKCAAPLLPEGSWPQGTVVLLSLLASAALTAAFLFSAGSLRLIGAVTLTHDFTTELTRLKRTMTAYAAVAMAPALVFYVLSPAGSGKGWLYVLMAQGLVILYLFLSRSLRLFISKKISILHWFLYLCTVELFPVSLLWLLLARA